MAVDDDLRLAWQAQRDGRRSRRDALLTLAVAAAARDGLDWADRLRDRLIADHPDHPFARYATLRHALDTPRVLRWLAGLRRQYPPGRVRWLLAQAEAARGPYVGHSTPLGLVLDDLLPVPKPPEPAMLKIAGELGIPTTSDSLLVYHVTILLGIAALLDCVRRGTDQGAKAA